MAQGALRYAAAWAVLVGGAAVEVVAGQSPRVGLCDWVVGAAFVVVGLARRRGQVDPIALLVALLWFVATVAPTLDGWWQLVAGPLVLAYRGPVLHLLAGSIGTGRRCLPLLLAAYGPPLVVSRWTGLATAAVAAVLGALLARRHLLSALVLAALAVTWAGTDAGTLGAVAGDGVLLLAAGAVAVRYRTDRDRGMSSMVAELSQDARPASPLSATIAQTLEDPDLQILVFASDAGWRDDTGRPVAPPALDELVHRATLATVPGGGSIALVHGPKANPDPDLSAAAARAAVLVLERVRVGSQIRRTAEEIHRSVARILAVEAQEREALAARLEAGPRRRLARVRTLLNHPAVPTSIVAYLDEVDGELDRLARGLLPDAVAHRPLGLALRALAANGPLPVDLTIEGPLGELLEPLRALVYFVTAETLTNIARHSAARHATVAVRVGTTLRIEVGDDGVGGATVAAGHGLQNLADRVTLAGGALTVDSPTGGPTHLVATVPLPVPT